MPKKMTNKSSNERNPIDTVGHERGDTPGTRTRKKMQARFSLILSTEEINKAVDPYDDDDGDTSASLTFHGPYADVRKTLDYAYHASYSEDRQWLQDSIIADILGGSLNLDATTPTEPWFVFLAGAVGAGKRYALNELVEKGRMPLLSYITVDDYDIRPRLPEYGAYVTKVPEKADRLTRREAGFIGEIISTEAMKAGKNVIFYCCPTDTEWYSKRFAEIRQEHPDYKIGIIHVTVPSELIAERAMADAATDSRLCTISQDKLHRMVEEIPKTIQSLRRDADYACEICGREELELQGDENSSTSWDTFQHNWLQTPVTHKCATEEEKLEAAHDAIAVAPPQVRRARRFSIMVSTEENHKVDDLDFYGPYADIRATLDYTYHSNYSKERQGLQDRIITEMLGGAFITDVNGDICSTPTEPFIVFTAGAMGAGKSHTIGKLVERGLFPLLAFVSVDPDEIRRHFPEYHVYVDISPEVAGELTRKEAGFVAEILTAVALIEGKNVLVDGSLRDSEWYKTYFQKLRDEFPNLKLSIIHVTAPRDAVFERAAARARTTGRVVPEETLKLALEQVPKSVKILGPIVDYFVELNNPPGGDIEMTTEGEDWESFENNWMQTCAYKPAAGRRSFLRTSKRMNKNLRIGGKVIN